jgi:hypothetical protein
LRKSIGSSEICRKNATSHTVSRSCAIQQFGIFLRKRGLKRYRGRQPGSGTTVVLVLPRSPTMTALTNPLFWNMKIKITILTLATFAALC